MMIVPKISLAKTRVLDRFESRDDQWTHGDFDQALQKEMGSRYKYYKDTISAVEQAKRVGAWPKTVEQFERSHSASFRQT